MDTPSLPLIAKLALFGWVPFVVLLFAIYPARKALLIGMIGGWLFLPVAIIKFKAIPEYSKLTAASYACLLGTMLFDMGRLLKFRPKWYDIPIIVFCCSPYISSIQNDLGWYDGVSAVLSNTVIWGIPYLLGRLYFPDWESFKELAMAILIGGVIYMPLCLWEIRMSPQLHKQIYGFSVVEFAQSVRMGGYRPTVFLQHGLAVGMWMISASLVGIWMWQSKTIKTLFGFPMWAILLPLLATTILVKSTGAILLLLIGLAILYSIRWTRTPLLLGLVMVIAPIYMYVRASGVTDGQWMVDLAEQEIGQDRAQSLSVRVSAENILSDHALEQPWFGWGRWNRNRVYDDKGKDKAVTDGLWLITIGTSGIVGLCALTAFVLFTPLMVWLRCPMKMWSHPGVAPAAAMAVLIALYMLDCILNAMPDPIFVLAIGGLTGIAPSIRKQLRNPAPAAAPMPTPELLSPMAAWTTPVAARVAPSEIRRPGDAGPLTPGPVVTF